jgi:carbonic anhydrase
MGHDHGHGHTGGHSPGESPAREHRRDAPTHVACFVLTCSDSRAQADDVSGRALREGL